MFFGRYRPLEPLDLSKQELQYRLERQWQLAIAATLRHRNGFEGLQQVDATLTRLLLKQHSPDAQAVLRIALTGRFFTEKELHHIGQSDQPHCPFCGAMDGISHRIDHCPKFQDDRVEHLARLQGNFASLPPVQREHAWALRPQGLCDLHQALLAIGWDSPNEMPPTQDVGQQHHLFVDGSCLMPATPQLRLASWSVALALPEALFASAVVAAGPLPTLIQTSFRAEIFAALKALQYVEQCAGHFCLWSDCAGVVNRLCQFQNGGAEPESLTSNCDLWRAVWHAMQGVKHRIRICKVPAHMDVHSAEDLVHEWAIVLNGAADNAAKQANLNRTDAFLATLEPRPHLLQRPDGECPELH